MRSAVVLSLLLPCVACDQATKVMAIDHLKGKPAVDVVDGFVKLVYAENRGAFLGLFSRLPDTARSVILILGVGAVLSVVTFMLLKHGKKLGTLTGVGLALILAGGIGNLIDRVARDGRVVDFMQMGVLTGPIYMRTGVFNVADIHIMLGGALVAIGTLRKRNDSTPDEGAEGAPSPAGSPPEPSPSSA